MAASLGLSAILTTSATAFDIVKYAGAGYLVVLGILAWRKAGLAPAAVAAGSGPPSRSRLLLQPYSASWATASWH